MIEQSSSEIIDTLRAHLEGLVDDRNLLGLVIFVQASNKKDSGLYMIGDIKQIELLSVLNSYFTQINV